MVEARMHPIGCFCLPRRAQATSSVLTATLKNA